jgi:hypothetical protein
MNIKSRLKKIEEILNIDSELCQCDENGSGKQKVTWTDAHDGVLENPSAVEAEYCGVCKREINELAIILNHVSAELPI